jgi:hypothetical protein
MGNNGAIDLEKKLQEDIERFTNDPYGFVMYAYPWGEPGTILANETGPDEWQEKVLKDLGHALTHGWVLNDGIKIDCASGIFVAVSSGHGIGKSALMAWLDDWWMSTRPNPQLVTTANTMEQLSSKTWREKAKWHKLLINKHWFKWTATRYFCMASPETWFSAALPWSEKRPEAFAGTHEKYVMLKFDEASAIPPIIWENAEGGMTEADGQKIWVVFGNPTQNTGRFHQCFHKDRSRWIKYTVDSRNSKRTDKELIQRWAELYGDDSDFFRIRVKGTFPRSGSKQFIGNDLVEAAKGKVIHPSQYITRAKILGVDTARYGDDQTVSIKRQGLASYGLKKHRGLNTQTAAGLIAQEIQEWKPDGVMLDMGNTGAAVYDILTEWGYEITPVWFGSESDDKTVYYNKRVEMWGRMRDWLKTGGCIPADNELCDDLIGPEYGFTGKEQYQLEAKEDMKSRGLSSPDCGDALALTFAYPVEKREIELPDPRIIKDKQYPTTGQYSSVEMDDFDKQMFGE